MTGASNAEARAPVQPARRIASVLVLGGYGETGARLTRLLVERTELSIVVAGRSLERGRSLVEQLGQERVHAIALDAGDGAAVRRALDGVDLLVNVAGAPRYAHALAHAVISARADWVDFQVDSRQARVLDALAEEIAAAGCCFVTQAGFHPGMPGALVRWAAARMDELREARVAGLLRERGGLKPTTGLDELLEGFRDFKAMRFEDGRWHQLNGWRVSDYPVVEFDFGFGRRLTFPMGFDELAPLPERIPSLRRLGFSVTMDLATNIVSSLMVPALALTGTRPRALHGYGRLLVWANRSFGRPPYGCVLQLDAKGVAGGAPVALGASLFHRDGYALTAIAGQAMIEQLLDGSARRPGLHRMGLLVEPARLLAAARAMGVEVRSNDPTGNARS